MKVLACRLVAELVAELPVKPRSLVVGTAWLGCRLVEFDTGFEQGFAVFDVARMDGGDIGPLGASWSGR